MLPRASQAAAGASSFALDQRPSRDDPAALCQWLQHRYVRNCRDDDLSAALSEILEVEDGKLLPRPMRVGTVQEARGLVVTAESGAGKSALLSRNLARVEGPPRDDGLPNGVLTVTVTQDATLKSLAHELCRRTGYPQQAKVTGWKAFEVARHRFRLLGLGVVVLDEAHHLLLTRRGGDPASEVLRAFKSLLQGESAVALILSGVPCLEDMIRKDRETSRRLGHLRPSPIADKAGRDLLEASILAYCRSAELEPVADPYLSDRLLHATQANLGSCLEMTLGSIRRALIADRRSLTLEDFSRVFDRGAQADDINPFEIRDWARDASRLPPIGGAAR